MNVAVGGDYLSGPDANQLFAYPEGEMWVDWVKWYSLCDLGWGSNCPPLPTWGPGITEPTPEPTPEPATDPPATDPPATDPPATDPPATDPPATEPVETPAPIVAGPRPVNMHGHLSCMKIIK